MLYLVSVTTRFMKRLKCLSVKFLRRITVRCNMICLPYTRLVSDYCIIYVLVIKLVRPILLQCTFLRDFLTDNINSIILYCLVRTSVHGHDYVITCTTVVTAVPLGLIVSQPDTLLSSLRKEVERLFCKTNDSGFQVLAEKWCFLDSEYQCASCL